jgi:hypothetical protein
MLLGQLTQVRQIDNVVRVLTEASDAVVPALDDMDRYTRKNQPQRSGHINNNDYCPWALTEFGL